MSLTDSESRALDFVHDRGRTTFFPISICSSKDVEELIKLGFVRVAAYELERQALNPPVYRREIEITERGERAVGRRESLPLVELPL